MIAHPILNQDIREDNLPATGSEWIDIRDFASSFYGYDYFGSTGACASFANGALEDFKDSGRLPEKLSELRSCLFFEQRRMVHFGSHPDEKAMIYIWALLEKIKEKVRLGDLL